MTFSFNTKNYHVNSDEKSLIEKKLTKLSKFFRKDAEVSITIKPRKFETVVEVTIVSGSFMFRAEKSGADAISAADEICEALERQLRKNKTRLEKKYREASQNSGFNSLDIQLTEEAQGDEQDEDITLIRTKLIPMKPMSPEEAVLQMNITGHEFFMFYNIDTNSICVVYARKNGGYGLLEPEF